MLKETFIELTKNYTDDERLSGKIWKEIETKYSNKNRHYHTLEHLDSILNQLTSIKNQINDWNTILFSLYFHDIVYNVLKKNNEERSAALAEIRMRSISVQSEIIEKCKDQIIATKAHHISKDNDTNYFTDSDLSILGNNPKIYSNYYRQIRKEYSIYPDLIYCPGRIKVLTHFLNMDRIFKTDYFFEKFEIQARENLKTELEGLQNG